TEPENFDGSSGNNEYWTLNGPGVNRRFDVSGTNNFDTSGPINLTPGGTYTWSWHGVDRGHGLTVWLPFSEITQSNAMQCPKPDGLIMNITCNYMTLFAFDDSDPYNV